MAAYARRSKKGRYGDGEAGTVAEEGVGTVVGPPRRRRPYHAGHTTVGPVISPVLRRGYVPTRRIQVDVGVGDVGAPGQEGGV